MKPTILLAVLLIPISFTFADDTKPRPQSRAAVTAMRDYDKAVKEADDAANAAKVVADKKLIEKLKPALVAATKAGDLTEANAISEEIKQAELRMKDVGPKSNQTYTIDAKLDWQPTISVEVGQVVAIAARGRWSVGVDDKGRHWCGPTGETIGGRMAGYLEMQIGDGPVKIVGSALRFAADRAGEVRFRIHDDSLRSDNEGTMEVAVTASR